MKKKIIVGYDKSKKFKGVDIKHSYISVSFSSLVDKGATNSLITSIIGYFGAKKVNEGIALIHVYDWVMKKSYLVYKNWFSDTYKIKEMNDFCCEEFEEYYEKDSGHFYFIHDSFHGWLIQSDSLRNHCLIFMRYCPFCGAEVSTDETSTD